MTSINNNKGGAVDATKRHQMCVLLAEMSVKKMRCGVATLKLDGTALHNIVVLYMTLNSVSKGFIMIKVRKMIMLVVVLAIKDSTLQHGVSRKWSVRRTFLVLS
jgi:hypothetical protein